MTIQELGSIGELLAAIATIVTLAYLALQIRQSNRSHELSAIARIGESTESWLGQVVQNEELLEVYMRGLSEPTTLSRQQRARFNRLVIQFLRGTETGWHAFDRNRAILSQSFAAEVERIIGPADQSGAS